MLALTLHPSNSNRQHSSFGFLLPHLRQADLMSDVPGHNFDEMLPVFHDLLLKVFSDLA